MALTTDPKERKKLQLWTFMFGYFVDAWLSVAAVARAGNDQHNNGAKLHWDRTKSTDQLNAAFNHLFDYGMGQKLDTDGQRHLSKAIWRLMAQDQLDQEAERKEQPEHGWDANDSPVDYDPTPWCNHCGARTKAGCDCGPLADND